MSPVDLSIDYVMKIDGLLLAVDAMLEDQSLSEDDDQVIHTICNEVELLLDQLNTLRDQLSAADAAEVLTRITELRCFKILPDTMKN